MGEYALLEYDFSNESKKPIGPYSLEISDCEEAAEQIYENEGFKVVQLHSRLGTLPPKALSNESKVPGELRSEIDQILSQNEDINAVLRDNISFGKMDFAMLYWGVPDFLIYRESDREGYEYRFIEVKSPDDKLRRNQLWWLITYSFLPSRVSYVLSPENMEYGWEIE